MPDHRRLWVEGFNGDGSDTAYWLNMDNFKYIQYVNVADDVNAVADVYFIDNTHIPLRLRTSQSDTEAKETLGLRVRTTMAIATTSGGAYSYTFRAARYGGGDKSYRRILANQIDISDGDSLGFIWLNLNLIKYVTFGNLPGITPHMTAYFINGSSISVERGFLSIGQPDTKANHELWHDNYFIKNYDQITYVGGLPVTNPGYQIPYDTV